MVLNLSHIVRKINRFELKYIAPIAAAEEFKRVLQNYLVPDEHGNRQGGYLLANLYYDTPDLRFYWEKLDGIKYRRKLRIRRYESDGPLTPDAPVFVEVKQRLNRVTQKRRVFLPYQAALRLCNERQIPQHDPQDAAVIEEVASMVWQYDLRPTCLLRYTRQAWIGTDYDIGLRVTFDTGLLYYPDHLLLEEAAQGLPMIKPHLVIIEIKVNERVPYWLTELVAAQNLNLVRISKYCRAIELSRSMPAPAWMAALV